MNLLLNILWLIFGGLFVALGYISGGVALCFTIVGIPWGFQCFKLAMFALFPFGTHSQAMETDPATDGLNLLLNIVWLIFGGLWVMLNHLFWGVLWSITIVGLPFGVQHFKMMRLALSPFGRRLVDEPI
jgi:uncharacterized membrane protein YccF (DUF307 family)